MANLESIRSTFAKSEEELLREWHSGQIQQILGHRDGDLVSGKGDLRTPFLAWVRQLGVLDLVCTEYCSKRNDLRDDVSRFAYAAALADLLLQVAGVPSPITIAVLLVKSGLGELCKCDSASA